jgi:hypothetical protein
MTEYTYLPGFGALALRSKGEVVALYALVDRERRLRIALRDLVDAIDLDLGTSLRDRLSLSLAMEGANMLLGEL